MSSQGIWSVLGIEPTQDLSVIKRAYARQLKSTRPDQDPEGYQRLREAFDVAKRQGKSEIVSDVVTNAEHPADNLFVPFWHPSDLNEMAVAPEQEPENIYALRSKVLGEISPIIDQMMEDETAGLHRLESYLRSELLQNLELRELFSQEMAAQLSEREGLYSALLLKVSGIMGWEVDNYQPVGISPQRLQSLQAQIDNTGANYYWSVMAREYQDSALQRLRYRLLTVEGVTVPWWAHLVPDFMRSLRDKVREIRTHYPALLPRINSALLQTLSETRAVLSLGTVFLTGFWLLLIMLATREHPQPWLSRGILIVIIGLYIHGYSYIGRKLHNRPRMLSVTECVLSILSVGIMLKMLLGFFTIFKPDSGNIGMAVTNYGVLSVISFCVLWMMAPKHWKWYGVPLNAMIVLLIFPWELMKKASGVVGVVAFVLLLFVYSLLIAVGFR